jgi:type I restriction enzyme M protein
VWFYDLQADGYSLDDKRTELKGNDSNDLPDAIAKWKQYRELVEANAPLVDIDKVFGDKTQKAFAVDAKDIANYKFDLSINRYKEVVYEEEIYEEPSVILGKLKALENSIMADLNELEGML